MDALTGEIELSKSGFSKGVVKYAAKDSTTQATVASLSNPLDGLKVSNSTVFGQVGVKSEITKQLKGTLSACYVSGPGAMGVETAISKAGGIGATLMNAFGRYDYDFALAITLVIIGAILISEAVSGRIRRTIW